MTFHHFASLPSFNRNFVIGIILAMVVLGGGLIITMLQHTHGDNPWRIAVTSWPGFDPLYLAESKGFFKQHNLNIELVTINTTTDMRTAFERGLVDGYTAALVDVVESFQVSQVPARIVLVTDYSRGGDRVLASPAIESPSHLAGAKVGVESTTALGRYVLTRALQGTALSLSNLNLVSGSQSELVQLAIEGQLDAVVTYEPFASQIQERRGMRTIFSSTSMPNEIIDVVAISPHVLTHDKTFAQRLQKAWQQALNYAATHPEEVTALHARRYAIPQEVYADTVNSLTFLSTADMQKLATSGKLASNIYTTLNTLTPLTRFSLKQATGFVGIHPQEVTSQ